MLSPKGWACTTLKTPPRWRDHLQDLLQDLPCLASPLAGVTQERREEGKAPRGQNIPLIFFFFFSLGRGILGGI